MSTAIAIVLVLAVAGFVVWKNKDRLLARVKEPERGDGVQTVPVVPTTPVTTPTAPTPTPAISRPVTQLEALIMQGLDLGTITLRMGRSLTDEERAICRAAKVPGSAIVDQGPVAGSAASDFDAPAFDWSRPNSPRIFRNGTTKTLKSDRDSLVVLHNGDMGGNEADYCMVGVNGHGVSIYQQWPVRYQTLAFVAKAGMEYSITTTADKPLVMSVRFEPV